MMTLSTNDNASFTRWTWTMNMMPNEIQRCDTQASTWTLLSFLLHFIGRKAKHFQLVSFNFFSLRIFARTWKNDVESLVARAGTRYTYHYLIIIRWRTAPSFLSPSAHKHRMEHRVSRLSRTRQKGNTIAKEWILFELADETRIFQRRVGNTQSTNGASKRLCMRALSFIPNFFILHVVLWSSDMFENHKIIIIWLI